MKEISNPDKLYYFERNFVSLDGVWMLETENEVGWDRALKIDLRVWKRLLKIILRRVKKYLEIETNSLRDFIEIMTFRWSIEGWKYQIIKNDEEEAIINIIQCPYKFMMDRNEDRWDKIPLVCRDMCNPLYDSVTKHFNPKIKLIRNKFMGLGDNICSFHFEMKKE
jgi:transposase